MVNQQVGVVAVGRETFDLDLAQTLVSAAVEDLRSWCPETLGDSVMRTTAPDVAAAVTAWPRPVDTIVVLFGSFTDSSLPWAAIEASNGKHARVVLWSFPEERTGGRLKLNSLCGTNLAGFRFGLAGKHVSGVYGQPNDGATQKQLRTALAGTPHPSATARLGRVSQSARFSPRPQEAAEASRIAQRVAATTIGVIGDPPNGFEPCEITQPTDSFGTTFEQLDLDVLIGRVRACDLDVSVSIDHAAEQLADLDQLDRAGTERALRLQDEIRHLANERNWDALGLRCWPECFTALGAAPCAALSFLTEEGTPAACEADAYGALTSLVLTEASGSSAFLADLVDLDPETDTAVFWHCGVAPLSMANPSHKPTASVHPNRGVPLTVEFGLKPGPVTIARISQSRSQIRLVLGFGHVLPEAAPYAGTSGVVALEGSAEDVFHSMINEGLEHHYCLIPGDYRRLLQALAKHWNIPTVMLTNCGNLAAAD